MINIKDQLVRLTRQNRKPPSDVQEAVSQVIDKCLEEAKKGKSHAYFQDKEYETVSMCQEVLRDKHKLRVAMVTNLACISW